MMTATLSIGSFANQLQAVIGGVMHASGIFAVIDRKSPISLDQNVGKTLPPLPYPVEIEFEHVKHIYPARPDLTVLEDFSLLIPAGKTTALVGGSGSGKSTIVSLLERFYEPVAGRISFDGHDITTLSVHSLRNQIALVSQEPVLFSTTIYENIRYGLIGSRYEYADQQVQRQLVVKAAKTANAHNFIMLQDEEYETNVGERGFLLSGGQRQRIAIARAIIGDPKVLLLDEATSALDAESERLVQQALEAASAGRTTISVAHRLSTIQKADNIVVMNKGVIVEQGTHKTLMSLYGAYHGLVEAQRLQPVEPPQPEPSRSRRSAYRQSSYRQSYRQSSMNRASKRKSWFYPANRSSRRHSGFDIHQRVNDFEKSVENAFFTLSHSHSHPHPHSHTRNDSDSKSIADSLGPLVSKHMEELEEEDEDFDEEDSDFTGESPRQRYSIWKLFGLVLAFNKAEWHWMLFGMFWSVICGCCPPAFAVIYAEQITALAAFPQIGTAAWVSGCLISHKCCNH